MTTSPVDCGLLVHVLKHPLSILILNDFLDVIGCSINGASELEHEILRLCNNNNTQEPIKPLCRFLDFRKVPYAIVFNNCKYEGEIPPEVLRWKNCKIVFSQYNLSPEINSSLVKEEEDAILSYASKLPDLYEKNLNKVLSGLYIGIADGHVISMCVKQHIKDEEMLSVCEPYTCLRALSINSNKRSNLSSIGQLTNLITLNIAVNEMGGKIIGGLPDELGNLTKLRHLFCECFYNESLRT